MVTARRGTPPNDLEKVRLVDILAAYQEAQGLGKLIIMVKLRDYLRRQDQDIVIDEIGTIWEVKDLNVVIGAGAPGRLYYAVLGQRARLDGLM